MLIPPDRWDFGEHVKASYLGSSRNFDRSSVLEVTRGNDKANLVASLLHHYRVTPGYPNVVVLKMEILKDLVPQPEVRHQRSYGNFMVRLSNQPPPLSLALSPLTKVEETKENHEKACDMVGQ